MTGNVCTHVVMLFNVSKVTVARFTIVFANSVLFTVSIV